MTPSPTFGTLLRQLRKRAGMTQGDLAAAVGYSVSFVSDLEQNRRLPAVTVVLQQFIPALGLQEEAGFAAHLVELAALARGEHPPTTIIVQHKTQLTVAETFTLPVSRLPTPPTELMGREQEIKTLCNRLQGHSGRLLTLVGPAGVGKSRLALAVATQSEPIYQDGAYFVPLAALSDPALVAAELVATLQISDMSQRTSKVKLIEFLRRKELLLVLDNFEQITPAAPLVAELLAECPRLRVLVTSRERLHLRAEQRYQVPPLTLAVAVALFTQRAQAVDLAFELTADEQPVIKAICQRLDCLPLAIELIAAQIDLFSPPIMLARLNDRGLDMLKDGASDTPEHQRTLRNAIHRSYVLCSSEEQRLFRTLGVFVGGFDLAAVMHFGFAEAVLQALLNKSLVRIEGRTNDERRFLLLETLCEYAYEQLTLTDEMRIIQQRHAEYFLMLAAKIEFCEGANDEKARYDRLECEHANMRAALNWYLNKNAEMALRLAGSLSGFWWARGYYSEGYNWLTQALVQNGADTSLMRAKALRWAGHLALIQGNYVQATAQCEDSLHLYQKLDDRCGIAETLSLLGGVAQCQNNFDKAKSFFEQSLALSRELDNKQGIGGLINNLGVLAMRQGDYDAAKTLFEESLAIHREENHSASIKGTVANLGFIGLYQGDPTYAINHFRESMTLSLELRDKETLAECLEGVARVAGLYKEDQTYSHSAVCIFAAVEVLRKTSGLPLLTSDRYTHSVSAIRAQLGEAGFAAAWAAGQAMTLDEAVAHAMGVLVK